MSNKQYPNTRHFVKVKTRRKTVNNQPLFPEQNERKKKASFPSLTRLLKNFPSFFPRQRILIYRALLCSGGRLDSGRMMVCLPLLC